MLLTFLNAAVIVSLRPRTLFTSNCEIGRVYVRTLAQTSSRSIHVLLSGGLTQFWLSATSLGLLLCILITKFSFETNIDRTGTSTQSHHAA